METTGRRIAYAGLWVWWVVTLFSMGPSTAGATGTSLHLQILDLLLGAVTLVVLLLRRRYPTLVALFAALVSPWAMSGALGALWAFASLGTTRNWRRIVPVFVLDVTVMPSLWAWTAVSNGAVSIDGTEGAPIWLLFLSAYLLWVVPSVAAFGVGVYVGARRDLLRSYQDQARLAQEGSTLAVQTAQAEERNRIAREMHDVVAHRISLISMQAGALGFREDLSREQTREVATQIQQNARLALDELRSVLGSLRNVDDDGAVAKPQPTLAQLPSLLDEARGAGQRIESRVAVDADEVPPQVSRHAFRIVQEGLTNARKHAAGTLVTLLVDRHDGGLRVLMSNPLRVGAAVPGDSLSQASAAHPSAAHPGAAYPGAAHDAPSPALPGSGQGLLGLRERAESAGGTFSAGVVDGEFLVKAWLPWPES